MSRIVRITESDLRAAVADERYWRVGHPERGAFQTWVGQGFRGLNPSDGGARTTVWVRAYMRGGHWVSSHFRGTPSPHIGEAPGRGNPRSSGSLQTRPSIRHSAMPTCNWRVGGRGTSPAYHARRIPVGVVVVAHPDPRTVSGVLAETGGTRSKMCWTTASGRDGCRTG